MKKKVPLIAILSIVSLLCQAQTFIPKIGFSVSNMAGKSSDYKYHNKLGFVGGLAFNIPLKEKVALQAELLYNQKGVKGTKGNGSSVRYNLTLDYLQLPLMVHYSKESIFFFAGPALGYGINGWVKLSDDGGRYYERVRFGTLSDKNKSTYIEIKNRWDISFIVGCGMKFKDYLVFDCRYDFGFTRVYKPDNFTDLRIPSGGNRSFIITIGVPIKKLHVGL